MNPYPRASRSEGAGVALSADLYNRMVEDIERLDKLAVTWPLSISRGAGGTSIGINLPQSTPTQQMTLVAILGYAASGGYAATGSGKYHGSILSGNDTAPATQNFQLQPGSVQSATDGPAFQTGSGSQPVNNALVINMPEQYVPSSHVLYQSQGYLTYAFGQIMGQTSESPPRTIVYVDGWPLRPVIAKISGPVLLSVGGVYYGRIAQGQFASNSNSYTTLMSNYANTDLPSTDTCWIVNNWEQVNIANSGHNALNTGSYVWGLMSGFPVGAYPGGVSNNNTWYMVYTWMPPMASPTTIQNLVTTQSANSSYSTNEQTMLENLKADVTNLRSELNSLYGNLKSAGYSL
jgi:hypothetical protein